MIELDSNAILSLIYEVARERNVDPEDVFSALEHSLLPVAHAKYGDANLSVQMNRKTGEITLFHKCEVVETKPDCTQISLEQARLIDNNAQLGDLVPVILPLEGFDRIAVHNTVNTLYKTLDDLSRIREIAEFTSRIGEIMTCVVKQTSLSGDLVVTVDKGTGSLRRIDLLPKEIGKYKPGDRIEAVLKNVSDKTEKQLHFSRTHTKFVEKLLEQTPEIQTGEVKIVKIARDPGNKTKIAVSSDSPRLDPVKICVGAEGNRIKAVINELKGERIDIIAFDSNIAKFAMNALKPGLAKQAICRVQNEAHYIILVVEDDNKKIAIGEKGSNVKLASSLTGAHISVLTTTEAQARQQELITYLTILLNVDVKIPERLVEKGFETIHDINTTSTEDLIAATQMPETLINAIKERIADCEIEVNDFLKNHPEIKPLVKIPSLKVAYIKILMQHGITCVENLAKQTWEHLVELLSEFKLTKNSADRFINYAKRELLKAQENETENRHYKNNGYNNRFYSNRFDKTQPSDKSEYNQDKSGYYKNAYTNNQNRSLNEKN